MSKSMKSFSLESLNNFDEMTSYLIKFVRGSWNVKNLAPKKDSTISFDGPDTSSAMSFSVEQRLNYENAMFDKEDQGRDFLTTFVSSCIAYGMIVEQERTKRLNGFKEKVVELDLNDYIQNLNQCIASEGYDKTNFPEDINHIKYIIREDFISKYDAEKYENDFEGYKKQREKENSEAHEIVQEILNERKVLKMSEEFSIGDCVVKKSNKPFKASDKESPALKYDYIESFSTNPIDPKNRECAFLKISKTFVNLYQLKKGSENV